MSGLAVRECGNDGLWKPNHDQNATSGWTNYSDCFKPDPILEGISVRNEPPHEKTNNVVS